MPKETCPVWVGYLLANPLRKLIHNPEKILKPYVKEGMKVLDIGCAMGFFSIPLAYMVGANGRVICVDIQKEMFQVLERRVKRAGLSERVETRISCDDSLNIDGLKEEIDFVLAFAVVHEVSDASKLFSEVYKAMKSSGKLLMVEPVFHVPKKDFETTVSIAEKTGFKLIYRPYINLSHAIIFGDKRLT